MPFPWAKLWRHAIWFGGCAVCLRGLHGKSDRLRVCGWPQSHDIPVNTATPRSSISCPPSSAMNCVARCRHGIPPSQPSFQSTLQVNGHVWPSMIHASHLVAELRQRLRDQNGQTCLPVLISPERRAFSQWPSRLSRY